VGHRESACKSGHQPDLIDSARTAPVIAEEASIGKSHRGFLATPRGADMAAM
jgi:hypothetical protein